MLRDKEAPLVEITILEIIENKWLVCLGFSFQAIRSNMVEGNVEFWTVRPLHKN